MREVLHGGEFVTRRRADQPRRTLFLRAALPIQHSTLNKLYTVYLDRRLNSKMADNTRDTTSPPAIAATPSAAGATPNKLPKGMIMGKDGKPYAPLSLPLLLTNPTQTHKLILPQLPCLQLLRLLQRRHQILPPLCPNHHHHFPPTPSRLPP